MHRHTPLTPVSLRLFQILPVLLHLKELPHRTRPSLGDDVTWFLRSRPVPVELGSAVRHATCDPVGGVDPTTGFPVRIQVVNWAVSGAADDRRPVPGTLELRDVHRAPRKFAVARDRRDTHLLVDLAVRRSGNRAAGSAADAVTDVRRER